MPSVLSCPKKSNFPAFLVAPAILFGLWGNALASPSVRSDAGRVYVQPRSTLSSSQENTPSDPSSSALRFLAARPAFFGLQDAKRDLVPHRMVQSRGDYQIVSFQRHLRGIPILNKRVAVMVRPDGSVALASGNASIPPSVDGDRSALPTPYAAGQAALEFLGHPRALRGTPEVQEIFYAHGAVTTPAWLVTVPLSRGFSDFRLILDARTGDILSVSNATKHAHGNAYSTNPSVGTLQEVPLQHLDLETGRLFGRYADVNSCTLISGNCEPENYATPDEDGNYFYQPITGDTNPVDPFAEVHMYYHVNQIRHFFNDLGMDDSHLPNLPIFVNIEGFPNAAFAPYDGGFLIFGQGRRVNMAYDVDVIYHEYTHAVIEHVNPMDLFFDEFGVNYIPSALNEGNADTFSALLSGDPLLGEYAGGHHGPIRVMDGNNRCPDHQIGMLHDDGLLWAQPAWEIRDVLQNNEEDRRALMWDVLNLADPVEGFPSFATTAVEVARERFGDSVADGVEAIMESRGLFECDRFVDLVEGKIHSAVNMSSNDMFSGQLDIPMPNFLQYRITVPEGVKGIALDLDVMSWEDRQHRVLARFEEPVGMRIRMYTGGISLNSDFELTHWSDWTIRERFGQNLKPGDYYITTMNDGAHSFMYNISYTLEMEEEDDVQLPDFDGGLGDDAGQDIHSDAGLEPDPDAQSDAGFDDAPADNAQTGEGCGCSLGSTTSPAPLSGSPLLLLAGLWLLRSKKRRS